MVLPMFSTSSPGDAGNDGDENDRYDSRSSADVEVCRRQMLWCCSRCLERSGGAGPRRLRGRTRVDLDWRGRYRADGCCCCSPPSWDHCAVTIPGRGGSCLIYLNRGGEPDGRCRTIAAIGRKGRVSEQGSWRKRGVGCMLSCGRCGVDRGGACNGGVGDRSVGHSAVGRGVVGDGCIIHSIGGHSGTARHGGPGDRCLRRLGTNHNSDRDLCLARTILC